VDYRELLKQYIMAVSESEGDDFAAHVGGFRFTEEESMEIQRLLNEANAAVGIKTEK
jgi:hypothetical protein